jgi:hypothetical protein
VVGVEVRLTPIIEPVMIELDGYFQRAGFVARVTSGLRDPLDQLHIIKHFASREGLDRTYPEITNAMLHSKQRLDGAWLYEWQRAWSALLSRGIIVNPPLPAIALYTYRHPRNPSVDRKGMLIPGSPHFNGTAFDIGGGSDGLANELAVIKEVMRDGTVGIRGFLLERENNCLHIDCV